MRISWSQLGMALLSERTLQALLYLGAALVLAATLTLTVNSFRAGQPWLIQQSLLVAGGVSFWLVGHHVRQRLGLRRSGGVLMDVGALWVPLNIGVAAYHLNAARPGSPTFAGVAIDAPANLLLICVVTAPVYAAAALRYRLVLLAYGAALLFGAAIVSGLKLAGVGWDWQVAPAAAVAPLLVLAAARLRRRSGVGELEAHVFWLAHAWVPAIVMILVALALTPDTAPLGRFSLAAAVAAGAASYGLAARVGGPRVGPWQAAGAALGAPLALVLALRDVPAIDVEWYAPVIAVLAQAYLLATPGAWPRLRLRGRGAPPSLAARRDLGVLPATALVLVLAALLYPWLMPASAAVTWALLAVLAATAALVFDRRLFEYASTVLAVGALALALEAVGLGNEWRGTALAAA